MKTTIERIETERDNMQAMAAKVAWRLKGKAMLYNGTGSPRIVIVPLDATSSQDPRVMAIITGR